VVVDLGEVDFLGVCGLRSLLAAERTVGSHGGHLRVRNASWQARRLFAIADLEPLLDIA
jgi:anti-anti-sigma factor